MKPKVFVDSNILIYSISPNDKRVATAKNLLQTHQIVISTQVINEFINVVLKRQYLTLDKAMTAIEIFINDFEIIAINDAHILHALQLKKRLQYSYWDSLIIAAALASGVGILYSEDMHHAQTIDGQLTIINPFLA